MERYKDIIQNWEEFRKTINKDDKTKSVRRNDIKAKEDFETKLKQEFEVKRSNWNEKVYRLKKDEKPGKTLLHWRGEYYVQEESATLPVKALKPQPGEKVLDMCAAPGGKTTQIADQINNKGAVIANDQSSNRLQSLHANTYRTGSHSAKVSNYDARNLPETTKFDKILLDAPCTGEGDRARRKAGPAQDQEKQSLAKLQKQLLQKANKLLKENGTIVYSTCTINPQENEAVVQDALNETDLQVREIENIPKKHQKGLTSFEKQDYSREMDKTVRIMPHHLNSGVIYTAKLTKE